ncbi:hypothetical protein OC842_007504 [Tilletia horrida]|uniref:F-box domain-containing protein n=1 Tax=Tilletia horrida TaxID=155126 RepID=A0AAN6G651_9BASI|nr:hypothetical protein OC842_007504 [Tilletia horrida]
MTDSPPALGLTAANSIRITTTTTTSTRTSTSTSASGDGQQDARLPPEILSAIFLHLDPHTLFTSVRALSRTWRNNVEVHLLPSQFSLGRWKVGLRIANAVAGGVSLPPPIHSTGNPGSSERQALEHALEAANAAALEDPNLAVARLRDMLSTPGTLETQLPLPGPRPVSIVTIPLTFVGYDRTTASLKFTSDAWHAITNSAHDRNGLLGCTFHIVWNEAGTVSLESAKPDPQNYWLKSFFISLRNMQSGQDSGPLAPNKFSKTGFDSPVPTKLISTPLAPRVLAPRNTGGSTEDRPSPRLGPSLQPPSAQQQRPHASQSSAAAEPASTQSQQQGPLDWSDASHHYLHLRTLALGIEFFTRQSARANLLTRKLEAERERRLRGENSSSDEDSDSEESGESESESDEDEDEDEETLSSSDGRRKAHDSLSSSISSLSLSRHGSSVRLKDLERAVAGMAASQPQPYSHKSSSSGSGSGAGTAASGDGAGPGSGMATAYMTAVQSRVPSGASTPVRSGPNNGGALLRPPTYADFARAAAKGAAAAGSPNRATGNNTGASSPIRPTPMRAPQSKQQQGQAAPGSPRSASTTSNNAGGGGQSPVIGASQLRKELDLSNKGKGQDKGKGKLRTPFSTPFSGTPHPPASPVPSRPGTPGPGGGGGKGKGKDGKEKREGATSASATSSSSALGSPALRARNGAGPSSMVLGGSTVTNSSTSSTGSPLRASRSASSTPANNASASASATASAAGRNGAPPPAPPPLSSALLAQRLGSGSGTGTGTGAGGALTPSVSTSSSSSNHSSGPPSLAPPGSGMGTASATTTPRLGPRAPRAHFHAVLFPAEHFSPTNSAASSPRLGPTRTMGGGGGGAAGGSPRGPHLTQPIMRSTSLGGRARRTMPGDAAGGGEGSRNGMDSFLAAKRAQNRENWDARLVGAAESELRSRQEERARAAAAGEGEDGSSSTSSASVAGSAGRAAAHDGGDCGEDEEVDGEGEGTGTNHGSVWRAGDSYGRGQWRVADRLPVDDDAMEGEGEAGSDEAGAEATEATEAQAQEQAQEERRRAGGIEWTWTRGDHLTETVRRIGSIQ